MSQFPVLFFWRIPVRYGEKICTRDYIPRGNYVRVCESGFSSIDRKHEWRYSGNKTAWLSVRSRDGHVRLGIGAVGPGEEDHWGVRRHSSGKLHDGRSGSSASGQDHERFRAGEV